MTTFLSERFNFEMVAMEPLFSLSETSIQLKCFLWPIPDLPTPHKISAESDPTLVAMLLAQVVLCGVTHLN